MENITLVSALGIAISALAGALAWVVIHWQKDKDRHIADKDILIRMVKDNTESHTLLSNNLNANTKATEELTKTNRDLHDRILESMIPDKTKKKIK